MLKEPENSWGEDTDGVWSGLIGYLQREEVDMSTIVAPTSSRLKAAKFYRSYPTDPVTIVSLKPQPLPRHLAFIRPFSSKLYCHWLISRKGRNKHTRLYTWITTKSGGYKFNSSEKINHLVVLIAHIHTTSSDDVIWCNQPHILNDIIEGNLHLGLHIFQSKVYTTLHQ